MGDAKAQLASSGPPRDQHHDKDQGPNVILKIWQGASSLATSDFGSHTPRVSPSTWVQWWDIQGADQHHFKRTARRARVSSPWAHFSGLDKLEYDELIEYSELALSSPTAISSLASSLVLSSTRVSSPSRSVLSSGLVWAPLQWTHSTSSVYTLHYAPYLYCDWTTSPLAGPRA